MSGPKISLWVELIDFIRHLQWETLKIHVSIIGTLQSSHILISKLQALQLLVVHAGTSRISADQVFIELDVLPPPNSPAVYGSNAQQASERVEFRSVNILRLGESLPVGLDEKGVQLFQWTQVVTAELKIPLRYKKLFQNFVKKSRPLIRISFAWFDDTQWQVVHHDRVFNILNGNDGWRRYSTRQKKELSTTGTRKTKNLPTEDSPVADMKTEPISPVSTSPNNSSPQNSSPQSYTATRHPVNETPLKSQRRIAQPASARDSEFVYVNYEPVVTNTRVSNNHGYSRDPNSDSGSVDSDEYFVRAYQQRQLKQQQQIQSFQVPQTEQVRSAPQVESGNRTRVSEKLSQVSIQQNLQHSQVRNPVQVSQMQVPQAQIQQMQPASQTQFDMPISYSYLPQIQEFPGEQPTSRNSKRSRNNNWVRSEQCATFSTGYPAVPQQIYSPNTEYYNSGNQYYSQPTYTMPNTQFCEYPGAEQMQAATFEYVQQPQLQYQQQYQQPQFVQRQAMQPVSGYSVYPTHAQIAVNSQYWHEEQECKDDGFLMPPPVPAASVQQSQYWRDDQTPKPASNAPFKGAQYWREEQEVEEDGFLMPPPVAAASVKQSQYWRDDQSPKPASTASFKGAQYWREEQEVEEDDGFFMPPPPVASTSEVNNDVNNSNQSTLLLDVSEWEYQNHQSKSKNSNGVVFVSAGDQCGVSSLEVEYPKHAQNSNHLMYVSSSAGNQCVEPNFGLDYEPVYSDCIDTYLSGNNFDHFGGSVY